MRDGRFRRVAPILAVEVAGADEDEDVLRAKAAWYLHHGVAVVWILLPEARVAIVADATGERRLGVEGTIDERGDLPGLAPRVHALFAQIARGLAPQDD